METRKDFFVPLRAATVMAAALSGLSLASLIAKVVQLRFRDFIEPFIIIYRDFVAAALSQIERFTPSLLPYWATAQPKDTFSYTLQARQDFYILCVILSGILFGAVHQNYLRDTRLKLMPKNLLSALQLDRFGHVLFGVLVWAIPILNVVFLPILFFCIIGSLVFALRGKKFFSREEVVSYDAVKSSQRKWQEKVGVYLSRSEIYPNTPIPEYPKADIEKIVHRKISHNRNVATGYYILISLGVFSLLFLLGISWKPLFQDF